MLIALIAAHCFFDYAGQGDFMAKAKNETAPIPGVPWRSVLAAHAWIHGSAVALITGLWPLFFAEYAAHFVTDSTKCRGKISYRMDQGIHIVCKFAWFGCAVAVAK
jgi:hypothetical protein